MSEQAKTDTGYFAQGCLAVVLGSLAVALLLCGGGIYFYGRIIERSTSAQPANIILAAPTHGQFETARSALERFRAAIANNREERAEFSATDLNALIAAHPDFAGARGRVRFAVNESAMTLDLSAPLDSVPLPKLKRRWFNGTARFTVNYEFDQFAFGPIALAGGGWRVPDWLLTSEFGASFSRSFSQSFQEAMRKNAQGAAFWRHIRTITVEGDRLVVTTQPAAN
jgi:hypothetical protein